MNRRTILKGTAAIAIASVVPAALAAKTVDGALFVGNWSDWGRWPVDAYRNVGKALLDAVPNATRFSMSCYACAKLHAAGLLEYDPEAVGEIAEPDLYVGRMGDVPVYIHRMPDGTAYEGTERIYYRRTT